MPDPSPSLFPPVSSVDLSSASPTPDSSALTSLPGLIRWSGLTDRGRVRKNNEDAFLALTFDGREVRYLGKTGESAIDGLEFIFAVSDGMGGANSGEIASRMAIDRITQLLPQNPVKRGEDEHAARAAILTRLFTSIHKDLLVLGSSYEECAGMGATLSLCWVTARAVHFAHVGDSRLYALPLAGPMRQLTDDHNHVGWLRRKGQINEREARSHPLRHSLHRAMGAGLREAEPDLGCCPISVGDRFLLCTDGVIDGLWDRHLDELVRDETTLPEGQSLAQRIVMEAVEKSGRDNATALVFQFPESPAISAR